MDVARCWMATSRPTAATGRYVSMIHWRPNSSTRVSWSEFGPGVDRTGPTARVVDDLADTGTIARAAACRTLPHSMRKPAVRRGLLSVNPAMELAVPRANPREYKVLSPTQAQSLLDVCRVGPEHLRQLYPILNTGLRCGEALRLRRRSVHLDAGTIDVREQLKRRATVTTRATPRRTLDGWCISARRRSRCSPSASANRTRYASSRGAYVHREFIFTHLGHTSITMTADRYVHPATPRYGTPQSAWTTF